MQSPTIQPGGIVGHAFWGGARDPITGQPNPTGGKYVHADYVNNGATQIGGVTSCTPSMTAGSIEGQFGRVTTLIGDGGPPSHRPGQKACLLSVPRDVATL